MAIVRYKNPTDQALIIWLSNWPNSGHPLDEERFMVFAKSTARYRNKKWLDYDTFKKALEDSEHHFSEEEIQDYYYKLRSFVDFHSTPPMPLVSHIDRQGDYGYYQQGVKDGRIYEVPISQSEYLSRGASKATLQNITFID